MDTTNQSYDLSFPPLPTPPQTPSRKSAPTEKNRSDSSPDCTIDNKSHFESDFENDAYSMALDDVHTRFLLNLPTNELSTADRIFFQLEQAYWFYDDFYCDNYDDNSNEPPLPRFKNLRHFCQTMFQISPLLSPNITNFDEMWEEFASYKRNISTYGTILMNEDCSKVALCQDWNGKSWTFPAGKINQHETGIEAGARETYEETGFDINCQHGHTRTLKEESNTITWKMLNPKDALTYTEDGTGKRRTCYVCRGVPEDFPFEPVARKEVSDIQWFDLNDLPRKTFAVLPFIGQLRKWIRKKGLGTGTSRHGSRGRDRSNSNMRNDQVTPTRNQSTGKQRLQTNKNSNANTVQNNHSNNTSRKRGKKNKSRTNSRGKVREGDSIAQSGLANIGDTDGWTEDEMFSANERILGRQITYDGNPHTFADAMANSNPHKFHIVGGSFMNGPVGELLAPPPDKSKLQPLFLGSTKEGQEGEEKEFEPFFSAGGETPWGEVVNDLQENDQSEGITSIFGTNEKGLELLSILQKGNSDKPNILPKSQNEKGTFKKRTIPEESVDISDSYFLTDAQITVRSQQQKLKVPKETESEIDNDWIYLQNWVKGLERPPPSKMFGSFKFDVNAIMDAVNREIK